MKRCFSVLSALVLAVVALAFVPSAMSQVIVYSVDFKHEDGFNVDFFEGGYFVAPALGGSGTFLLTARDHGRKTLTSSAGTGNFFHGLDEHEKRISVVSATGGDGTTSNASYVAFGDVTSSVEFATSDAIFKIKVAKKLKGYAIAAGSEANTTSSSSTSTDTTTSTGTTTGTTTPTDTTTSTGTTTGTTTDGTSTTTSSTDGTIGFAAISSMTMTLDEGQTKKSNELDQTQEQAVASLVVELQQKGYVDSSSSTTGTGTGTTTGTGTGTTTTATPEIAVAQGFDIADGGTKDFGTVAVGFTTDLVFIISNTGGADLTGLTITLDGTNASEFTVTVTPTTPVTGPTGSTTFTVRFTPASAEAKTAAIHISNNDSDENPFDITLTGSGS